MAKLVLWINTVPERAEMFIQVMKQLKKQVRKPSVINIHFDGFSDKTNMKLLLDSFTSAGKPHPSPSVGKEPLNIVWTSTTEKQGTAQRLIWSESYEDDDIAAIIDDDIMYPPNYFLKGTEDLQKYGGLVTYHGKNYPGMNARTQGLHFTQTVQDPHQVHVPGGGVMFARMGLLKKIVEKVNIQQFAFVCDMALALGCWKWGVKITRAPSEAEWLKPFGTEGDSIWRTKKDERRAAVAFCVEQGWPGKATQ